MKTLFVNCHIPKTAGTSLIRAFQDLFGMDRCLVQVDPSEHDFLIKIVERADRLDFASGHITIEEIKSISGALAERGIEVKSLTSIRDPIRLFVSAFFHAKRFVPLPDMEREASIAAFLHNPAAYPTLSMFCSNSACKYLSGEVEHFSGARSLISATKSLEHLAFIFDAEDLQASFDGFRDKFGFTKAVKIERLNENSLKGSVNEYYDLLPKMAAINEFDCSLYHAASANIYKKEAEVSYVAEEGGFFLSEAIRRVGHEITAERVEFFEFRNNDLLLHLPNKGKTEVFTTEAVFQASGYVKALFEIELDGRATSEAKVEVKILSDVGGGATATKNVIPGKKCFLRLEATEIYGPCRVEVSSQIARGKDNSFGILWLLSPRISLRP